MSALRNIRMLARYGAWADARLYEALAALPENEITRRRNAGSGSILRTLNHAFVVDLIWQANLQGKPHGFTQRNTDTLPAFGALREQQRELDAWYVGCADALDQAAHDEAVQFRFVDGGPGTLRRGDMLLHIVNHKTYHRGYVAEMLYESALKPPTIDLPVYLRDVAQDDT